MKRFFLIAALLAIAAIALSKTPPVRRYREISEM